MEEKYISQQVQLVKEPLKFDDVEINSLEELKNSADIKNLLEAYHSGMLLKFCSANCYNDLVGQIQELNDKLIFEIYRILNIDLDKDSLQEYYNSYYNKIYKPLNIETENISNQDINLSVEFRKYCKEIGFYNNYDVIFIPIIKYDDNIIYYNIVINDKMCNVKLQYFIPNNKTDVKLIFNKVICTINALKSIYQNLLKTTIVSSSSGECGYGLELI